MEIPKAEREDVDTAWRVGEIPIWKNVTGKDAWVRMSDGSIGPYLGKWNGASLQYKEEPSTERSAFQTTIEEIKRAGAIDTLPENREILRGFPRRIVEEIIGYSPEWLDIPQKEKPKAKVKEVVLSSIPTQDQIRMQIRFKLGVKFPPVGEGEDVLVSATLPNGSKVFITPDGDTWGRTKDNELGKYKGLYNPFTDEIEPAKEPDFEEL